MTRPYKGYYCLYFFFLRLIWSRSHDVFYVLNSNIICTVYFLFLFHKNKWSCLFISLRYTFLIPLPYPRDRTEPPGSRPVTIYEAFNWSLFRVCIKMQSSFDRKLQSKVGSNLFSCALLCCHSVGLL